MTKLKLTLACGAYDRTRALIEGGVQPEPPQRCLPLPLTRPEGTPSGPDPLVGLRGLFSNPPDVLARLLDPPEPK